MSNYPHLPLYILSETVCAFLTFSAVQLEIPLSLALIAFYGELTKLAIAIIVLTWGYGFQLSKIQTELLFSSDWKQYITISFPAVIYLFDFFLPTISTPSFLHLIFLAKLPIIAILHHFLIARQQSSRAWIAFGFLVFGMSLFNLSSGLLVVVTGVHVSGRSVIHFPSILEPFLGLLMALVSGFTSVYMERILKQKIPFWVTQTWLYAFGSVASAAVLCFGDNRLGGAWSGSIVALHFAVVATIAIKGLIVAIILRTNDNLVKIVGTSASIILIVAAQYLFYSKLQAHTAAGLGITIVGTWTYSYYKEATASANQNEEYTKTGIKNAWFIPNRSNLLVSCAAVLLITLVTGFYEPLKYHKQQPEPHSIEIDIRRFFAPLNITPTPWGPGVNPPRCSWDYIIQHNITTLSPEILDWEEAYLDSGCPVFPVPDEGLIFHLYWHGPWRPQNDFTIEAFLATQRLGDGHRIIFWHDDGGPPESTRKYFQIYSDYVEFREVDIFAESHGTCLELMREWSDVHYRDAMNMPIQTLSDIFRVLILARFGGIWMDADLILLRDLTSVIRMGPAVIGMPDGPYTNAIIIHGPAYGGVGEKVLSVVCRIPYNQTEFHRMWPSNKGPSQWFWLYNSELASICEYLENCGIGRLPAMWTDGMYWGSRGQPMIAPCVQEDKFGGGTFPLKFRGLFTAHLRLDNEKDSCIDSASSTTAGKLRKLIQSMLAEGLYLDGRDVFPRRLWYDY